MGLLDLIEEEMGAGEDQSAPTEKPTTESQSMEPTGPPKPPNWTDFEETDFQEWYKGWAEEAGINAAPAPNPPR